MQLAVDVGPVPMHIGALLLLETGPGFSLRPGAAAAGLGDRIRAVPRLRPRLRQAPPVRDQLSYPTVN